MNTREGNTSKDYEGLLGCVVRDVDVARLVPQLDAARARTSIESPGQPLTDGGQPGEQRDWPESYQQPKW